MRSVSVFIFFLLAFKTHAEEHTVFEKDGFYGIKDQEGNIAVPPVYDQLGWSDHSLTVIDNVIGFKENGSWGLISVKNKILVKAKYHSIEPFEKLFKCSIKGKFSNQLFYGLLNPSGKTTISFNYFSLEKIGQSLLVSIFDNTQKFGVIGFDNKWIISPEYESIALIDDFFYAYLLNNEFDLFDFSGIAIMKGLNKLEKKEMGFVGFKSGYAGYINANGEIQEKFIYKDIQFVGNVAIPVPFPEWGIYFKDQLKLEVKADSVNYDEHQLWKAYVNGTHYLSSTDSTLMFKDFFLMDVSEKHYLLKDSRSGKWSVFTREREKVLQNFDSIFLSKYTFWGKKRGLWELFNRYGKKKNRFSYQTVDRGIDGQFIVQLNGYWGIMDPLGNLITPIKYNEIEVHGEFYRVSYLGRQGIIDQAGAWKVRAEYDKVFVFNQLLVGRKAYSYSYFDNDGFISRNTLEPIGKLGEGLLVRGDSLFGLLDFTGKTIARPEFEKIKWIDGFYELSIDGNLILVDSNGNQLFGSSLNLQATLGNKEGLFLAKKNNKWGFLDIEGRLRISNSYDSAQLFSEGYAPIKINDRWGFIDKDEKLSIQPYYDEVKAFSRGLSIVRIEDKYGIVDHLGNEIVNVAWKSIQKMQTGNYLFVDSLDKVGLISNSGKILFRPTFDSIDDLGDLVIVAQNGKKGILDYSGNQIFRIEYKEIKISGDYTILKY